MRNIVFIGMMGCGKTAISKMLAERLVRPWYDCDEEIEKGENMSISGIFSQKGEAYFRQKESECIRNLSEKQGAVISTGGGVVLNGENITLLKNNGFIIYLRRSVESIVSTLQSETRPLLRNNPNALYELYEKRYTLYERYSDIIIDNEGSKEQTLQILLEALPCL